MSSADTTMAAPEGEGFRLRWADLAPFIALAVIVVIGALINSNFMAANNLLNVITRTAFIAIIGVGATFVIATGGLDLSIGSMLAFVVGIMIMSMNAMAPALGVWAIPAGAVVALIVGSLCGLLNGVIITVGKIEPFIVTLGTMGIFRAFITWMTDGGSLSIDNSLRGAYRPVYFGSLFGIPYPVVITIVVALIGAFVLYRTKYGRRVTAVGSNADVARFSGVHVGRVRTMAFVIQGFCVAVAAICYVPRLGAATPTTGQLWELQVITAVVIGGTLLRGGKAHIWGTVAGALILEVIANVMVLSDMVSEYLVAAVQGAIIIIAMLAHRFTSAR
ncbi:ABC transporter permease [Wenxinia marina]|uniref:Monosaccharide ABC transporter membrane protein, CUT2 family n=1 Tax=Wenxinia marina DSM 24838 TaxID=1123501 RepID=A0A0D0NP44_9RHOB|nr:ABC transporter permease [Wenxinia marina]KIQ70070.1 monosaccharide ABC transporter membrane protein, CUT2 family [Wenxinia marina DSM 24838]GGL63279.1 ABC transporter permease [Wenxinia marina]